MSTLDLNSTNRVQHAIVRESTFGVTPTNPAFRGLRVTGSTLNANPQTVASDEIRSDRQVADLALVGTQAQGDLNAELSFASQDPDLEEALQSAWTSKPNIVNTASNTPISALSTTTITVTAGGAAFLAGSIAQLSGFPTAANAKAAVVVSSTATSIVFPASTFTAETLAIPVGATIRVVGFQGASADITATASGLGSTTLDFTTLGLVVGEWVKIGGALAAAQFATALDNDWCRVSAIATHALTFDRTPTGWTTDSGTGKTISVFIGDYLRNGISMYSNTIERQYQDIPSYEYLTGMVLDKMSLTLSAQKVVTLQKSYIGRTGTVAGSRVSGATDIAAPTYQVLNASANIGRIGVNGSNITGPNFVMETSLSINNNLRALYAMSSVGAVGMGNGESTITGSINTYFGDTTLYTLLLNNTATSFDFRVGRADGNQETLLFDMPRVKFASGAPSVPGKNQNVMLPLAFQALRDPTYTYQLHVGRYWYHE